MYFIIIFFYPVKLSSKYRDSREKVWLAELELPDGLCLWEAGTSGLGPVGTIACKEEKVIPQAEVQAIKKGNI